MFRSPALLLCLLLAVLSLACGSPQSNAPGAAAGSLEEPAGASSSGNPAQTKLPGMPGLLEGASNAPSLGEALPPPRQTARAGVDFAANRFIVIFENAPTAQSIAPYLGNGKDGQAEAIRTSDNAPLVQDAQMRRISHNLAEAYGLEIFTRVFYGEVSYAAYELDTPASVAELDALMLKVLSENRGLVREVCYDMFVEVVGIVDEQGQKVPAAEFGSYLRSQPASARPPGGSLRSVSAPPNDPMHLNRSGNNGGTWANWRVGSFDTYTDDDASLHHGGFELSSGSQDVLVAVIDTGCRMTHEDLVGNVITPAVTAPYNEPGILTDVFNKDNDPADDHGHGTACSGCVGAVGNNAIGLSGNTQNVRILPVKVIGAGGWGSDAQVAEGMLLAGYLGAEILSISLGGPFADRTGQLACQQLEADGVLVIVAAGNGNTSAPSYPAFYNEVVAIGGTTLLNAGGATDFSHTVDTDSDTVADSLPIGSRFDGRVGFSHYGPWVDLAAPAHEIRTTAAWADDAYAAATAGTSFACPTAAGCAALLWSYIGEEATDDQVRGLLIAGGGELTTTNNMASPAGFIDGSSNGTVKLVNVRASMDLHDAGGGAPPNVSWDNPVDGATINGMQEIRLAVNGGEGTVTKVTFETLTRQLAVVTEAEDGFYRFNWDTAFEFNRELPLTAKVFDDLGNYVKSTIHVTPDNVHASPGWTADFAGLADDALPAGWFELDGNQVGWSTSWGGDNSLGDAALPCLHTSGSSADFAGGSKDWLFAPIIDLREAAGATLSFNRRYQRSGAGLYFMYTLDDETYLVFEDYNLNGLQDWSAMSHDLTFLAGKEVRILWVLEAGGGGSGGSGLWLDDFSLSNQSGTPPTVTLNSPLAGDEVAGMVPVQLTLSDDTVELRVEARPPVLSRSTYADLPDNDPDAPTKTFTFYWDSRHVFDALCLLTIQALDDENGDTMANDLMAQASVELVVANGTAGPGWYEGFEDIDSLGGTREGGTLFDGEWYLHGNAGPSAWVIDSSQAMHGSFSSIFCGPGGTEYGSDQQGSLYSPMHSLAGSVRPMLRIYQKLDLEGSGVGQDFAKIQLLHYFGLDESPIPLAEYRQDSAPAGEWVEQIFDLSSYRNAPMRLHFQFVSDGDSEAGAGWSLDSYEIIDADPQIAAIFPARGLPGKVVTLSGENFGNVQGTSFVSFQKIGGGTVVAGPTSWSADSITLAVPADAKTGDVTVSVLGYESPGVFFGVPLPAPDISGIGQL